MPVPARIRVAFFSPPVCICCFLSIIAVINAFFSSDDLPKDKFTEAVIFAGADAYAHAKGWAEGMGLQIAGNSTPPIYLGSKQLAELVNLRIIDSGRRAARVYVAGDIEPILINVIAEKLALAGVVDAKLYKGIPDQQPENWREHLARLRTEAESGETLVGEYRRATGMNKPVEGDLSRMAASQRGRLLAQRYGDIAVNTESECTYVYDGAVWQKVADSKLQRKMVAIFNENEVNYSLALPAVGLFFRSITLSWFLYSCFNFCHCSASNSYEWISALLNSALKGISYSLLKFTFVRDTMKQARYSVMRASVVRTLAIR